MLSSICVLIFSSCLAEVNAENYVKSWGKKRGLALKNSRYLKHNVFVTVYFSIHKIGRAFPTTTKVGYATQLSKTLVYAYNVFLEATKME